MYDEAMQWLDQKLEESKYLEEDKIIEYIKEQLFWYNDLQNS